MPPVNSPEEEQKLSCLERAKTLQKCLDHQINRLQHDRQMLSILEMSVKDSIPCNIEHQAHYRRVLEILIGRLNLKCKVSEKVNKNSTCVTFSIIVVPEVQFGSPEPRSQVSFNQDMLEVNNINAITRN